LRGAGAPQPTAYENLAECLNIDHRAERAAGFESRVRALGDPGRFVASGSDA
jgi:hypothetical protein